MKRTAVYITAALVAALAIGTMVGCGGQSASSASAQASSSSATLSASASASESAAAQSTDELVAELKASIANAPAFKSVTVTEEGKSTFTGSTEDSSASAASSQAASEPDSLESTTIYKFDASGDKLKTSSITEVEGVKLQYFTDGDEAVFVTDGPAYSGTVEQFGLEQAKGFDAYLKSDIGDLSTMADCAAEIEKMESSGLTFYMMTLDPEKYIASDEALSIIAESGDPVKEALLTVGFEEDGSITSIDLVVTYEKGTIAEHHMGLSDYDSTVVDPMPATDKTYEDMEADVQSKLDAFEEQIEGSEA